MRSEWKSLPVHKREQWEARRRWFEWAQGSRRGNIKRVSEAEKVSTYDRQKGKREREVREVGASACRVCPPRSKTSLCCASSGICHHWAQLKPIWGAPLSAFQTRHETHGTHGTLQHEDDGVKHTGARRLEVRDAARKEQHRDQQDKGAETLVSLGCTLIISHSSHTESVRSRRDKDDQVQLVLCQVQVQWEGTSTCRFYLGAVGLW